MLMYDVCQRLIKTPHNGNDYGLLRWRISYTGDNPIAIGWASLVGLGLQLGLEQVDVCLAVCSDEFPLPLSSPEIDPDRIPLSDRQWLYRDAAAALIALGERKRAS